MAGKVEKSSMSSNCISITIVSCFALLTLIAPSVRAQETVGFTNAEGTVTYSQAVNFPGKLVRIPVAR